MTNLWMSLALLPLLLTPALACADGDKTEAEKMAAEHQHDAPKPTEAAMTPPAQEVAGEDVVYAQVGGQPVHGYLARPKSAKGPLPGLIVIHEWWGLNDNIRQMTKRLAGEGYTALAVDLYGGQTADKPDAAMQLMQKVMKDMGPGEQNVRAAYQYLETQQKAPKIGVIGWCFGGGWSLQTALLAPDDVKATVIYYGHLETDKDKLRPLQMPVIGFFGGKDQSISPESVHAFEAAMKGLGKSVEVHIYDDANHAFANASGGNYNPAAAKDAWERTTAFLAKHLK